MKLSFSNDKKQEGLSSLAAMRREYTQQGLRREDLASNPFLQFGTWFEQAIDAGVAEPNAMSLATVGTALEPSLRTVLLKMYDEKGFVFFTNYNSQKAKQIAENPQVALLFAWIDLGRQVQIRGRAEKISSSESLTYFLSRPRGAQMGAWVSQQSSVIGSRQLLDMKFGEIRKKFSTGKIPLPDFWGGYRVVPKSIEFWQGRENRLHDRFVYTRAPEGQWSTERLSP